MENVRFSSMILVVYLLKCIFHGYIWRTLPEDVFGILQRLWWQDLCRLLLDPLLRSVQMTNKSEDQF